MAAPGFGFSVGDFIAGVTLVRKLIQALSDSAGAGASYRQLISELSDLDEALTGVSNLQLDPAHSAQKIALEQVSSQCQLSIISFLDQNAKFEGSLGIVSGKPTSTARWLQAGFHKIQWALCKDSAVQALRTKIRAHTTTLNLLVSTIQIASANLQRQAGDSCMSLVQRTQAQTDETVALVKQNHQLLTSQADQIASISSTVARFMDSHKADATEGNDLRSLVTNALESNVKIFAKVLQMQQQLSNIPAQVNRQQPIVFEDAHGTIAPFHVEFINSLAVFQAVLEARFQDVPGLKKVKNLEYALQDVAAKRKIDLTKSWTSMFRPGRRVNMSMVFPQTQPQSSSCPGCFSENVIEGGDLNDDIQCSNTLCGLWYRRVTEIDNSIVEGKLQDDSGTEEQDAINEFRRVQILHLPEVSTSEMKEDTGLEKSGKADKTNTSSRSTWSTSYMSETDSSSGSMWSTQQPVLSHEMKTKINSKGQFVTFINHKQLNRQDEESPTYKSAKTYGKQA